MNFSFSAEEQELLEEVRSFLKTETSEALFTECEELGHIYGGKEGRKFIKKFAAHGWLTPNWPPEYGGLGTSATLSFAIREEMAYVGTPLIFVAAHMAGPTIMHFGSQEMKDEWLLPIAKGEVEFCLGYTEPQAGSDLAALNIRAVDKGDTFLLNGQKTFNTHAHVADYHWLGTITDPDAKKYRGMSLMIVDLKSPGIDIRPMVTMAGWQTNEVFYDDVIVPKENLVGDLNMGFFYVMHALDYERMFPLATYEGSWTRWPNTPGPRPWTGNPCPRIPLSARNWPRWRSSWRRTGICTTGLRTCSTTGRCRTTRHRCRSSSPPRWPSASANTGMEVLGMFSQLKRDSKWAALAGKAERFYRTSVVETIYAGTSEVQRGIIALRGLELPRK